MKIPPDMLSERALRAVVHEFVSREGTDYGHQDWEMDEKIDQVLRLLETGEVVILGDLETGTCNVVPSKAAEYALTMLEQREPLER